MRIAKDPVQRRPQFVAHVGEELGLCAIRRLRRILRCLERDLRLLARQCAADDFSQHAQQAQVFGRPVALHVNRMEAENSQTLAAVNDRDGDA